MSRIAAIIESEFFTLRKAMEFGFSPTLPNGKYFLISFEELQKFTKAINDKIEDLESNH